MRDRVRDAVGHVLVVLCSPEFLRREVCFLSVGLVSSGGTYHRAVFQGAGFTVEADS